MGTVWAARDEVLARDVAAKEVVPPPGLAADDRAVWRERTLREARAAARIASPSVVTVFDAVDSDERLWIVMERLGTQTLADVLHARGPLTPKETAVIGLAVLDGLEAAHAAGVLHRDVKPGNVMVGGSGSDADGVGARVVLGDFGIARLDGDPSSTGSGVVMGSPPYLAPERAQGGPATPASDLWSFGATLYAAVEGHPPYQRDGALPTLAAIVSEDAPAPLAAGPLAPLLTGLLSRDPAARPDLTATREQLARVASGDVEQAAAHEPPPAAAPPPVIEKPEQTPRRPSRSLLAALAALAAVLVALVVAVSLGDTDAPQDLAGQPEEAAPSSEPTSPPADDPSEPAPSEPADAGAGVPDGFELYEDETGLSVAVPEGWEASRDQSRVRLDDPDSSRYLLVDQTDDPQPDPVQDWRNQEESVSQRLPGYELISIEPVDFRDFDSADWQFTFDPGEPTRVLNRNVITGPDQAYALYWSVPAAEYDESLATFDVIAETFTPAS